MWMIEMIEAMFQMSVKLHETFGSESLHYKIQSNGEKKLLSSVLVEASHENVV